MRILLACLVLVLGGCARDTPISFSCPGFESYLVPIPVTPGGPIETVQIDSSRLDEVFDRSIRSPRHSQGGARNMIVLSGGGKWGAYGAGLNQIWGQQQDPAHRRPSFDVVTGISTGALQSTFVFLETAEADNVLVSAYNIREQRQLANSHGGLFFLHSASMGDTKPLINYAKERVRPYLRAVAEQAAHRTLLVGVVNANDGNLYGVDLTRIAADPGLTQEAREDCYVGSLLASAAIPVVFQQVRINNVPYFDGGVRQSVFLPSVQSRFAQRLREAGATGNLYVLFNGDPGITPRADVPPTLLDTLGRLREITFDQIEQSSVYAVSQTTPGMTTYVTTARGHNCPMTTEDEDFFDPRVMECLICRGRDRWASGNPWSRYPQGISIPGTPQQSQGLPGPNCDAWD